MPTNYPRTTAQIAGHPVHPMLVPFPIAFFVATLACDFVAWRGANAGWAEATLWLLGAGLLMAALAALAGIIEFAGDRRIARLNDAWWHAGGNAIVVVLEAINLYMRLMEGPTFIVPGGLLLSLASVALLGFTGWKGGALVFRYRVAVRHQEEPL